MILHKLSFSLQLYEMSIFFFSDPILVFLDYVSLRLL